MIFYLCSYSDLKTIFFIWNKFYFFFFYLLQTLQRRRNTEFCDLFSEEMYKVNISAYPLRGPGIWSEPLIKDISTSGTCKFFFIWIDYISVRQLWKWDIWVGYYLFKDLRINAKWSSMQVIDTSAERPTVMGGLTEKLTFFWFHLHTMKLNQNFLWNWNHSV